MQGSTIAGGYVAKWEQEQREIKKVAARFPKRFREDLEAELSKTLVELKRGRRPGIRNRKAYRITALWNRARTQVKRWRKQDQHETSIELAEIGSPSIAFRGSRSRSGSESNRAGAASSQARYRIIRPPRAVGGVEAESVSPGAAIRSAPEYHPKPAAEDLEGSTQVSD